MERLVVGWVFFTNLSLAIMCKTKLTCDEPPRLPVVFRIFQWKRKGREGAQEGLLYLLVDGMTSRVGSPDSEILLTIALLFTELAGISNRTESNHNCKKKVLKRNMGFLYSPLLHTHISG